MLFWKKSKKKETETKVEPVQSVEESVKEIKAEKVQGDLKKSENPVLESTANEGRRFTLVVENAQQLEKEQGILVGGNLYGNIQTNDMVYMILPNQKVISSKVSGIEIGKGQGANKAENQMVVLRFEDIKNINQVPKYTVLTSIHPQEKAQEQQSIENPQPLGLSRDYYRLVKDQNYFNVFVYALCHAYYLVPVRSEGASEDGTQERVQFPAMRDPKNENKTIFPVFTDWITLAGWKDLFEDKKPPKAVILRFPDVVKVCQGNGMMINPFGPTAVMIPDDLIAEVVKLEGYKQEFGEN